MSPLRKKVVVAMSGGVDSSVAAALLKEQGYDVYGITMRLSDRQESEGRPVTQSPSGSGRTDPLGSQATVRKFGGCCGSKDFYDARSVAQTLGIPHYSFDYVEKFKSSVIEYFKESYLKGETPNPCIACNQQVKFDALLSQAIALGADYVATGHYARIMENDVPLNDVELNDVLLNDVLSNDVSPNVVPAKRPSSRTSFLLKKAVDSSKDQSYVLYGLGQKELSRLLFPLGGLTKMEVREIARRYNLRTADKPDSYEICFVPNEDYRQFISEEVPESARPAGLIRHVDGRVLGKHRGLPYYTIGQREGLGISVGKPLYVTSLDATSNTLIVGDKKDVLSRSMVVRQITWVAGLAPSLPLSASVKIRSKHEGASATLDASEPRGAGASKPAFADAPRLRHSEAIRVVFEEPQSAVTPGQAAVFYEGDIVLGGGVIDH